MKLTTTQVQALANKLADDYNEPLLKKSKEKREALAKKLNDDVKAFKKDFEELIKDCNSSLKEFIKECSRRGKYGGSTTLERAIETHLRDTNASAYTENPITLRGSEYYKSKIILASIDATTMSELLTKINED